MAIFPTGISTDADLYIAVDNFGTTLNGAINASQTTITLTSVVGLPTVGILTIDSEKVHYTGISVNDITGATRGFSATTASTHSNGATVLHNVVEEHHNILKDEIIAIETHLGINGANVVQIAGAQTVTGTKTLSSFSGTLAANIAAATFKLTGLGAGTTAGDSVRYEDVVRLVDAQTIAGQKTFSDPIIQNDTSNQLVLGITNTTTISATAPSASRILTIPDPGANASFAMSEGTQTLNGQKTFGAATLFSVGTAALPGIAFDGDPDTGILSPGANRLGFSTGGSERWEVTSAGDLSVFGGTERLIISDGSLASPALQFANDTDTGIYRVGANVGDLAAGGTRIFDWSTAGVELRSGVLAMTDGTEALPSVAFSSDLDCGMYRISADRIGLVVGGVARLQLRTTFIEASLAMHNIDGSAASPAITFASDTDTGFYRLGADNIAISVGGSRRADVGTTSFRFLVDVDPNGPASNDMGDATNYWNEINYKTLTDRGCLPWCDDGVELCDGSRVTDLEALCSIEKHPTELTIHGLPKLNYATFPKKAYVKAAKDGTELPRDANDLPVGGADGVEMTMIFGVMIGAFKQLKAENDLLKARLTALEAK